MNEIIMCKDVVNTANYYKISYLNFFVLAHLCHSFKRDRYPSGRFLVVKSQENEEKRGN